jgi:hypothetical protein
MSYSIIITASFIKSHPSINFIKCVIESLNYIKNISYVPIIIAHDYSNDLKFLQYIDNLKLYILDKTHIKIIIRDSHGHLTGNIRNAFQYVNTEYVLIIQHDLPFIREVNIEKIIEDMQANPELKHVRFNKRKNIKSASDSLNDLFGKQVQSINFTYTRTPSWSDQNHLSRSEYYRNIILAECADGKFMEQYLIKKSTDDKIHTKYGTYIFGKINDDAYIKHIDGRVNTKLL